MNLHTSQNPIIKPIRRLFLKKLKTGPEMPAGGDPLALTGGPFKGDTVYWPPLVLKWLRDAAAFSMWIHFLTMDLYAAFLHYDFATMQPEPAALWIGRTWHRYGFRLNMDERRSLGRWSLTLYYGSRAARPRPDWMGPDPPSCEASVRARSRTFHSDRAPGQDVPGVRT
jgi:hypothetical protein